MTRNQIILVNIVLAIPIVPIRVVLFILYWLTKWLHEGADWMFDRFPSLINVPKTQKQIEKEERKAVEGLKKLYERRKQCQQKFLEDVEQDKFY